MTKKSVKVITDGGKHFFTGIETVYFDSDVRVRWVSDMGGEMTVSVSGNPVLRKNQKCDELDIGFDIDFSKLGDKK